MKRVTCLKNFGSHSQAFSTMQPDMSYFEVPDIGYIAHARRHGLRFVLSDPICHPQHRELMLDRFLAESPNAFFVQVSKAVVDHLHRQHGYYGTQFGSESRIDLASWSLRGSKKQIIRTAINQARNQGIEIRESGLHHDLRKISQAWIRTRRCKHDEIRFLTRPIATDYTEGTRYFYAYHRGEAVGFVFFDPAYRNGRVVSYVPNISRACASFRQGLWYALMAHAMDVFKTEGVAHVDLGLVPLMMTDSVEPQESRLLRALMSLIRERMDFLYSFKGLEFAKSRFEGTVEKTYCCHRNAVPGLAVLALLRLTRLI